MREDLKDEDEDEDEDKLKKSCSRDSGDLKCEHEHER